MPRRLSKKHQSKAGKARVSRLSADELSDRMRIVAAGNEWTQERRAEFGRRMAEARAAARARRQSETV